ncbi:electron transporter SenC [Achromobacter spanius]|uniref:electron transporter SenC n=1 Tax=Achromobacter spanius TaxID=217203 RepID=UPI003F68E9ED
MNAARLSQGRRIAWPMLLAAGVVLSAWQWHEAMESPATHSGHTHLHDDSGKPARLYAWNADQAARVTLLIPAQTQTSTQTSKVQVPEQTQTSAQTLMLQRGAQGWHATPAVANFDVADFLTLFSHARSDRILTPHAGESYGLNPPALRIAIDDANGAALARMDVGALTPDGLGRYVQLPNEPHLRIIPNYQTRAPMAATMQVNP